MVVKQASIRVSERQGSDGDAEVLDARLFAGRKHGGDVLEFAAGIAAHQHAQVAVLPPGGSQRRGQLFDVDRLSCPE